MGIKVRRRSYEGSVILYHFLGIFSENRAGAWTLSASRFRIFLVKERNTRQCTRDLDSAIDPCTPKPGRRHGCEMSKLGLMRGRTCLPWRNKQVMQRNGMVGVSVVTHAHTLSLTAAGERAGSQQRCGRSNSFCFMIMRWCVFWYFTILYNGDWDRKSVRRRISFHTPLRLA